MRESVILRSKVALKSPFRVPGPGAQIRSYEPSGPLLPELIPVSVA